MPRPRNLAHRDALLAAATSVFAEVGLGASTASIAKAAGVSTGTLFVYFDSKTALVNALYVALKTEMGEEAVAGVDAGATSREQLQHMWRRWEAWALASPEKRRALAHLSVAEDLTADSHDAVHAAFAGIAILLEQVRADGPLRAAPLGFVVSLMSAIADATIDDLLAHPAAPGRPDDRSDLAFDALWRALAGADLPVRTS